jgi:hypothetical protein
VEVPDIGARVGAAVGGKLDLNLDFTLGMIVSQIVQASPVPRPPQNLSGRSRGIAPRSMAARAHCRSSGSSGIGCLRAPVVRAYDPGAGP